MHRRFSHCYMAYQTFPCKIRLFSLSPPTHTLTPRKFSIFPLCGCRALSISLSQGRICALSSCSCRLLAGAETPQSALRRDIDMTIIIHYVGQLIKLIPLCSLHSAGMCTIEGKTGIIAATDTTQRTDITRFPISAS